MRRAALVLAVFLAAVIVLAGAAPASAQDSAKGDPRVAAQLDRLGIKYKLTDAGNYSITYDVGGGRSQVAYIMGRTETYRGVEIRELWSRAGTFEEAPDADQMQKLLEDSGTEKIGFWALEEADDGGSILYFSVKVPVYLNDSDLLALLYFTASVSDEKEKELFNTDEE